MNQWHANHVVTDVLHTASDGSMTGSGHSRSSPISVRAVDLQRAAENGPAHRVCGLICRCVPQVEISPARPSGPKVDSAVGQSTQGLRQTPLWTAMWLARSARRRPARRVTASVPLIAAVGSLPRDTGLMAHSLSPDAWVGWVCVYETGFGFAAADKHRNLTRASAALDHCNAYVPLRSLIVIPSGRIVYANNHDK